MAQDAITCSIFGQFEWNLHNWKILERSAHCFSFLILDTSQSNLRHPPFLLVWFAAHPRNYISSGISHGVYQFIVANLEKLSIYLGQERVKKGLKLEHQLLNFFVVGNLPYQLSWLMQYHSFFRNQTHSTQFPLWSSVQVWKFESQGQGQAGIKVFVKTCSG